MKAHATARQADPPSRLPAPRAAVPLTHVSATPAHREPVRVRIRVKRDDAERLRAHALGRPEPRPKWTPDQRAEIHAAFRQWRVLAARSHALWRMRLKADVKLHYARCSRLLAAWSAALRQRQRARLADQHRMFDSDVRWLAALDSVYSAKARVAAHQETLGRLALERHFYAWLLFAKSSVLHRYRQDRADAFLLVHHGARVFRDWRARAQVKRDDWARACRADAVYRYRLLVRTFATWRARRTDWKAAHALSVVRPREFHTATVLRNALRGWHRVVLDRRAVAWRLAFADNASFCARATLVVLYFQDARLLLLLVRWFLTGVLCAVMPTSNVGRAFLWILVFNGLAALIHVAGATSPTARGPSLVVDFIGSPYPPSAWKLLANDALATALQLLHAYATHLSAIPNYQPPPDLTHDGSDDGDVAALDSESFIDDGNPLVLDFSRADLRRLVKGEPPLEAQDFLPA
ncbi:hypothetical protein H9P43_010155 [Blastocladiella emersonii ATCC 22665]|nr:hypothetical protein H9P43_010155 [Blastocladiella emersonii ATCC 22665]